MTHIQDRDIRKPVFPDIPSSNELMVISKVAYNAQIALMKQLQQEIEQRRDTSQRVLAQTKAEKKAEITKMEQKICFIE